MTDTNMFDQEVLYYAINPNGTRISEVIVWGFVHKESAHQYADNFLYEVAALERSKVEAALSVEYALEDALAKYGGSYLSGRRGR